MTIDKIKKLTQKTQPYFFTPDTMRFFNQTLKDFKVITNGDGRFKIIAPIKDSEGSKRGQTVRYFNPRNNNLELN